MAGRTITVFGVKGGVGVTAVAVNLAARLARENDTLLAPLPGFADAWDLAAWFGAGEDAPAVTREAVLSAGAPELLDGVLIHPGERLRLLVPSDPEAWGPDDVVTLARLAAGRFPWTVIDAGTWSARPGPMREGLRKLASRTCLVLTPDLMAGRRARACADALAGSGRSLCWVANRVNGRRVDEDFDVLEAFRGTAGVGAVADVPESVEVAEGLLQGRPAAWTAPRSPFSDSLAALVRGIPEPPEAVGPGPGRDAAGWSAAPAFRTLKRDLHRRFLDRLRERGVTAERRGRERVARDLAALVEACAGPEVTPGFRAALMKELLDDITGYGPLQDLLDDPEITEVMVNGPGHIYVEREGRLSRTDRELDGEEALRGLIERIVAPLGRRVDEASPLVDARLPDGSRVNAIIPPLALGGSCLTIRKFSRRRLDMEELGATGALTREAAAFLEACVRGRINLLISGGTGSGKTTLLNALSACVGPAERIVTIEDAAELKLVQEHVVRLEARPPNLEGRGAVPIRELLRNALRMRPDRIIVGEVRGGEALDMLQAMNTGHEGSLSTLHANSPRDALSRLETMVLTAGGGLPLRAIRDQIASAVDVIVQIARLPDGRRVLTGVVEVNGMEGEVYRLQDIFARRGEELTGAGLVPAVSEKLRDRGVEVPAGTFA